MHGRYGQPCPDCGSPVQRIVYAANEANYCAQCQTGGRLLADRSLSRLLREDWPRTLDELERRRKRTGSDSFRNATSQPWLTVSGFRALDVQAPVIQLEGRVVAGRLLGDDVHEPVAQVLARQAREVGPADHVGDESRYVAASGCTTGDASRLVRTSTKPAATRRCAVVVGVGKLPGTAPRRGSRARTQAPAARARRTCRAGAGCSGPPPHWATRRPPGFERAEDALKKRRMIEHPVERRRAEHGIRTPGTAAAPRRRRAAKLTLCANRGARCARATCSMFGGDVERDDMSAGRRSSSFSVSRPVPHPTSSTHSSPSSGSRASTAHAPRDVRVRHAVIRLGVPFRASLALFAWLATVSNT